MAGVAAGSVVTSARVTGGTVPLEDAGGNAVPPVGDAAGSFYSSYRGAAPRADIVVVKLREAKRPLRNFYNIPEDVPAYAETDIMLGISGYRQRLRVPPALRCNRTRRDADS